MSNSDVILCRLAISKGNQIMNVYGLPGFGKPPQAIPTERGHLYDGN